MKYRIYFLPVFILLSCSKQADRTPDTSYNPDIAPSRFSNSLNLTNKYFVFDIGKTYIYEGQHTEGKSRIESTRLALSRLITGIPCIIIEVKEYLNGKLIEFTHDWFAQDNEGNVWYFGEQVDNYDLSGKLTDHHGSWEAGLDGAKAGIIMLYNPQPGIKYRQEYYFNEAEDEAEVLSINESIVSPLFNSLSNCIKTKEYTELEPDALEHKFYAPGIGLVKIVNVTDKEEIFLTQILK
ncbi:MAG: hypothetical protein SH818_16755 [Saprospiraceae bacterium]|nr:hypothetical protein [Saprospiraceae bacterium]